MKKFFNKILQGMIKIIIFLFHLFFPKAKKKEENIEEKSKNEKATKEIPKPPQEENDTANASNPQNIFKEHLKFTITPKQIEKELNKCLEEAFKIKISYFSEIQKEKLKKYTEKIIKKVEKEISQGKITQQDNLNKFLKENIKQDILKKGKDINKILEIEENFTFETAKEKERTFSNKDILSIKIEEPTTIHLKEGNTLQSQIQQKEKETKEEEKRLTIPKSEKKSSIEIVKPLTILPIVEQDAIHDINQKNPIHLNESNIPLENSSSTMLFPKEEEKKEQPPTMEPVKKEEIQIPKKEKEPKKEILPEKKKNNPVIEINFKELEKETNIMKAIAATEYNKKNLIDKEYAEIEELVNKKIEKVETFLQKTQNQEQKEKLTKELEKLHSIKEQIALHKEQDLEEYRISLEETISITEINQVTEKLQEFCKNTELEEKKKIIDALEKNTKEDLKKIEKELIKEQIRKTVHRLEIPLFLSFPFIKNKHFRRFVGGLFIFRSFGFIKRWLFGNPIPMEPIDLSGIKKGSDALKDSISLTEKNIASFAELKKSTLEKYPELIRDKEFINNITKLENALKKNYEELLKQEQVVNKYFDKSKDLIRKRKRKWI